MNLSPVVGGLRRLSVPSPVFFVDLIAEAHRVDHGQLELHVALLQVVRARPQVDAVLIVAGLLVLEHGVEERVH